MVSNTSLIDCAFGVFGTVISCSCSITGGWTGGVTIIAGSVDGVCIVALPVKGSDELPVATLCIPVEIGSCTMVFVQFCVCCVQLVAIFGMLPVKSGAEVVFLIL